MFAIGWVGGALVMWIYFRFFSGLHRTDEEFERAKEAPDREGARLLMESKKLLGTGQAIMKDMHEELCDAYRVLALLEYRPEFKWYVLDLGTATTHPHHEKIVKVMDRCRREEGL